MKIFQTLLNVLLLLQFLARDNEVHHQDSNIKYIKRNVFLSKLNRAKIRCIVRLENIAYIFIAF